MCYFSQAIKEAATELLFGGHETTASTATSLVMFLGLNPEVVQKVREELQEKVSQRTYNLILLFFPSWEKLTETKLLNDSMKLYNQSLTAKPVT